MRDFGARGDGLTDDSRAIQRANDAAAKSGGTVYVPPGTYLARAIQQSSGVTITGPREAILKHPDGRSGPIVTNRRHKTTGAITTGSTSLRVVDPSGARPGELVAISGAGGHSSAQWTTLTRDVGPVDALAFASWVGWPTSNHVAIGDEAVAYGTASGALRFFRGALGTTPASHAAGTRISQLSYLYARVVEVDGDRVTIDRPAAFAVAGTTVYFGSSGHAITGLTLDGNRPAETSTSSGVTAIEYHLARSVRVQDVQIRNAEHGGVSLDAGTRGSVVSRNVIIDVGSPDVRLGAGIWLFRGASDNTIADNTIAGTGFHGIFVDDRTQRSSMWDASPDGNVIERNTIASSAAANTGVLVVGGSDNIVRSNVIAGQATGIRIERSTQGTGELLDAARNRVVHNQLGPHSTGIYLSGGANVVDSNTCEPCVRSVVDEGTANTVIDPARAGRTIEPVATDLSLRRPASRTRKLRATLTSRGAPVSGERITFVRGARELCSATTDVEGRAKCRSNHRVRRGQLVTASFDGSDGALPSAARARVR